MCVCVFCFHDVYEIKTEKVARVVLPNECYYKQKKGDAAHCVLIICGTRQKGNIVGLF